MASEPGDDPFRLEDEGESPSKPSPTPLPPQPAGSEPFAGPPAPRRVEGHDVSAVPVRERIDPGSRTKPGSLAPPPDWPREAVRYPLRGRGVLSLLLGAAVLAAADLLTRANAFLGAVVKTFLLAWVLRWQMRAIVSTAGGDDRPPRAFDGADFDGDSLAQLLGVLVRLVLYLLPAAVAYAKPFLKDPKDGAHDAGSWALVAALASLALLLAPVVVLGVATGNRRMTWPWGALPWLFRGFRACLVVALGWAALVPAEAFVAWLPTSSLGASVAACLALRVLSLHLLLVGGRALGVLGRRFEL